MGVIQLRDRTISCSYTAKYQLAFVHCLKTDHSTGLLNLHGSLEIHTGTDKGDQ